MKPENYIIRGATKEECLFFPHEIKHKGVDLAIFDENLELDGTMTIQGTDLAKQARRKDFKGCLVLHSANGDLKNSLDQCFDGFVEKTSKKSELINALARVWNDFLLKTRKEQ